MPGRRLEGAQSVERWQSVGHFPDDLYMSFCHVKKYRLSKALIVGIFLPRD